MSIFFWIKFFFVPIVSLEIFLKPKIFSQLILVIWASAILQQVFTFLEHAKINSPLQSLATIAIVELDGFRAASTLIFIIDLLGSDQTQGWLNEQGQP